jgi:hypothetical protein
MFSLFELRDRLQGQLQGGGGRQLPHKMPLVAFVRWTLHVIPPSFLTPARFLSVFEQVWDRLQGQLQGGGDSCLLAWLKMLPQAQTCRERLLPVLGYFL